MGNRRQKSFLFVGRGKSWQVGRADSVSSHEDADTPHWPFRLRRPVHGDVDITQMMDRNAERQDAIVRHYGRR